MNDTYPIVIMLSSHPFLGRSSLFHLFLSPLLSLVLFGRQSVSRPCDGRTRAVSILDVTSDVISHVNGVFTSLNGWTESFSTNSSRGAEALHGGGSIETSFFCVIMSDVKLPTNCKRYKYNSGEQAGISKIGPERAQQPQDHQPQPYPFLVS